jgi:hypothetical protein
MEPQLGQGQVRKWEEICRGLVPWVPWAAGYGPKNLDTIRFPPVANGWGTKNLILDMAPPLLAKEEGPPT